jgi:flagellar basal-body rod protein FlgC
MGIELIPAIAISSSGLDSERLRMDVTANNLANVHSTRGPDGNLYRRKVPVFSSVMKNEFSRDPANKLGGVKVDAIVDDRRDPVEVYAPYHPEANQDGMVQMPNISPIEEMLDMITATRAYEANLNVIKSSRDMADKTLRLGKG